MQLSFESPEQLAFRELLVSLTAGDPGLAEEVAEGIRLLLRYEFGLGTEGFELREDDSLPESVQVLVERYKETVEVRVGGNLAMYAALMDAREYLPRTQFFDMEQLAGDGSPECRAVRAMSVRAQTGELLKQDILAFFDKVEAADGLAVWTTFLPPGFGQLEDSDYLGFFYVYDTLGRECTGLVSERGVRWLPFEGAELTCVLSAALVASRRSPLRRLHKRFRQGMEQATATELSTSGSVLEAPLLSPEQAAAAAGRLWAQSSACDAVAGTYVAEATGFYLREADVLMSALRMLAMKGLDQQREFQKQARLQQAKTDKRTQKTLERLQMAYDGLKARAARQEALIQTLRQQVAGSPSPKSSTASQEPENSFSTELADLFGLRS